MSIPAYDWIAYHAKARGGTVAMEDLATGRSFTYAEFDDRVGRLASAMRSRFGVTRGDRVAVLAHNSTDLFELQFACARLGAVFAPLNWRLTVPELTFIVGDSQPVVLFHDPEFADTALELSVACGIRHLCGRDPRDSAYERLIAGATADLSPEPLMHDDVATILYTSGTTGRPKGAIITHGMRFWQTINLTGPCRVTADSTCLVVFPQFHVGGLDVFANPVFHFGGKAVVMRAYDPALALRLLTDREANITHFIGAPAHFQFMAQLSQFSEASFNPNLLAYVAAAPVSAPLLHQWQERGLSLIQLYGMTEACGVITSMEPWDAVRKAGSAGLPCLHFDVRLVRTDGSDAAVGEIGEIWVRGPSTTPGYWRREEATAAAFTDGWFRTGDAATMDADGYYTIVDRWKDMYISGGENVYPAEVEDVLYQLSAIAEVAIIGVADERWGEVGRAVITVKPDHVLTEAEIYQHCEANLARYKHPRSIRFVDALPRNATGKVHKPTLRQQFGAP
jgi:fatty-acyl-CoA synthase